jgi:hypothetical protein
MESRFVELARTDLSDKAFFEEVFLDYIRYVYPTKETSIQELAQIRHLFKEDDPHIQRHLRDKIEQVLYRYNKRQHEIAVVEKLILKRKIEQMDEKIGEILKTLDRLSPS